MDYTWYDSAMSDVTGVKVSIPGVSMVSNPDCACWFLHRDVIDKFRALTCSIVAILPCSVLYLLSEVTKNHLWNT